MSNDPFKRPLDDWDEWESNQPGLKVYGWGPILLLLTFVFAGCLFLFGCAHEPITQLHGPGGALRYKTSTGVVFTANGEALWIKEGVPASLFHQTADGPYLSNLEYHEGDKIRMENANK